MIAERRKKRTLLHIRDLLNKRVPQAEAACTVLDDVVTSLGAGSTPVAEQFDSFFAQARRLRDLCDRLAAASPAAADAIVKALNDESVTPTPLATGVGSSAETTSGDAAPTESSEVLAGYEGK